MFKKEKLFLKTVFLEKKIFFSIITFRKVKFFIFFTNFNSKIKEFFQLKKY